MISCSDVDVVFWTGLCAIITIELSNLWTDYCCTGSVYMSWCAKNCS